MKGNNRLILNEATLVEAVQEYLDKRMIGNSAGDVLSVKAFRKGDGYDNEGRFEVVLTEGQQEQPK